MSIRDMEMLGIGKPNDTGGTETEGTVMAKENTVLKGIGNLIEQQKILSMEQIWGKWVTASTISGTVVVRPGETKSTIIKIPKGAWFAYMRTRVSSWTGASRPSAPPQGSIEINGKTYPISIANSSNVSGQYRYYTTTYTGFNEVGASSTGSMIWDNFVPFYPCFAEGEAEFTMKLSSQDTNYDGTVGGTVEMYILVGEE